ncbi:MAG: 2-oxoglutarate dehydrogenase complex dihydrolipoyllysine-residue succinyltransferase [Alphaproteobacteria bacterium]|nr:MAG: 2-oxoglutarate dehydrogenase complex dihydrolipoyllysine-residue succinyltransferase [Alphaproteobacteria bacterium]TAF16056.1 MAG: 2-oxoglutarate dehydrogenase complex dihydrolipoyllysine-residue succinyltransferase [Alphaproteobacteria bacterium]TAF40639.1 MAG: 2-oxoglutarate dehydrogenase complex dihydrolipoyllysine-residue succinyltransferase [Alphaproteobacteria bacterium]TAF75936.1 MAG: 2-oxoglutarate dehydrogenase complex dihydrolipoyllysine-residue succinyltransferase [Alphaprote
MCADIVVPSLGESVSEATIAKWFKKAGDAVKKDEPLVELETDKVSMEVNSPCDGVLESVAVQQDATVNVGTLLGVIREGAVASTPAPSAPASAVASTPAAAKDGPAATKMLAENPQIARDAVVATGKDGRVTKGDVLAAKNVVPMAAVHSEEPKPKGEREERVKMTKLRQVISRRLKDSQNTAAILTTFNEIDMSSVIELRSQYKDDFERKFGIKLGFMGFFVKAAVNALQELPEVNAQIDGDELVYKNYYDIGVAVGTENGLVVPVIRDADKKSLSEIEGDLAAKAQQARKGTLAMKDLQGGTFTISNGGVYGSLMSTPIINPPQSGILGMHKTEERPVVVNGQIVIRPMMYVALSYDHRIIDGRESVTFLKRIKESIEDPRRFLLGL